MSVSYENSAPQEPCSVMKIPFLPDVSSLPNLVWMPRCARAFCVFILAIVLSPFLQIKLLPEQTCPFPSSFFDNHLDIQRCPLLRKGLGKSLAEPFTFPRQLVPLELELKSGFQSTNRHNLGTFGPH